ncbi:uncharacterized protein [Haliotis asinina]|uniref:uncharacterized protein n=1 Tax=Haliotis asinina TaxID=109174 RepID=UPI00353211D6
MKTAVCVIIALVAVTIHAQNSVAPGLTASNAPLDNTANGVPLSPVQNPSPIPSGLLAQASNVFNNNHPTATANNHQRANNNHQSSMNYLPFLVMGGDKGRRMAMYSMMMNPGQTNNMIMPYAMMSGVDNMWPLMALMGNRNNRRGGRGFDPMTMMWLGSEMI